MISLFAKDLMLRLSNSRSISNYTPISIDIGLTTEAYYTDKSIAISESKEYKGNPHHVHLMGYDTVIRFLAPKYYAKFDPPLSALNPYFDTGHSVQVLLRPTGGNDDDVLTQRLYLEDLRNGSLAKEGFKKEWTNQIELLEDDGAAGVSSTSARDAAAREDWESLSMMVPHEIMLWIQSNRLYQDSR
jgi:nicotinamide-nucleotide adenylyltransferase